MSKIIEVSYTGGIGYFPTIEQVKNYLQINMTTQEFLNFENYEGVKNSQIIFHAYGTNISIVLGLSDENGDKIKTSSDITPDMICPHPIVFYIDSDKITIDLLVNQSNLLINDSGFSGARVNDESGNNFKILENNFYESLIATLKDRNPSIKFEGENNTKMQPKHKVWVWCKAFCDNGVFNDFSVFDLSPFIQNISTNQTETGGNFSMTLLAIDGFIELKKDKNEISIWHPHKNRYVKFVTNSENHYLFKKITDFKSIVPFSEQSDGDYFQKTEINRVSAPITNTTSYGETCYIHNEIFFKNIISENDMMFISFDSKPRNSKRMSGVMGAMVDIPVDNTNPDVVNDFFVNCKEIANNGWDMIGLVDSNSLQLGYEEGSQEVNISGRDCMKLLLEDGTYFFAKSFSSEEESGVFGNINLQNSGDGNNTTNKRIERTNPKGINRLMTNGIIDMLYNQSARNVEFVMNLLISRLANIEICPNKVFESYGDEITEFLVPNFEYIENTVDTNKEENGD